VKAVVDFAPDHQVNELFGLLQQANNKGVLHILDVDPVDTQQLVVDKELALGWSVGHDVCDDYGGIIAVVVEASADRDSVAVLAGSD